MVGDYHRELHTKGWNNECDDEAPIDNQRETVDDKEGSYIEALVILPPHNTTAGTRHDFHYR